MKKLLGWVGLVMLGLFLGFGLSQAVSALSSEDADHRQQVQSTGQRPGASSPLAGTTDPVVSPNDYRLTGPYAHENLTVYLIHGTDQPGERTILTLQEALEGGLAVVHETDRVGQLTIENRSTSEAVFVQSGDIVKGGKQDRALEYDLVVPPGSGKVPLASFCVEQGRWSPRGKEHSRKFTSSSAQLATKELKLAAKYRKDQGEVWSKVYDAQSRLSSSVGSSVQSGESASSLQLTLESPAVQAAADRYCQALAGVAAKHSDAIGLAFAINGRMNSAEVYGSGTLFRKLWPKLLKASAVEAVAERKKGPLPSPVSVHAVRAMLADAENGRASIQTVGDRMEIVMQETDRSLLFETRDQRQSGTWIHRTYLAK